MFTIKKVVVYLKFVTTLVLIRTYENVIHDFKIEFLNSLIIHEEKTKEIHN